MKFGQLLECNMRTIFLENSYTKCGGENSPRLFPEKLKLSIPLDQQCKVLYGLFLLYAKLRAIEICRIKVAYHLLLPHIKGTLMQI